MTTESDRAEIMRVLRARAGAWVYLHELSAQIGRTPRELRVDLRHLVRVGLVSKRVAGTGRTIRRVVQLRALDHAD